MRKTAAIFKKQLKDTIKNKEILIQFLMFPIICLVMTKTVKMPDLPSNMFVVLFSSMYVGMAPLIAMSSIVAEEKSKNTLRVLLMSNVKAVEYLVGVGSCVMFFCLVGSLAMGFIGGYQGKELLTYLLVMLFGVLISIVIGAAIGTISRSEMHATSITVPIMLIFSFLPMISMFNENVLKISRFTFSQQVNTITEQLSKPIEGFTILVFLVNFVIASIIFIAAYRKSRLA